MNGSAHEAGRAPVSGLVDPERADATGMLAGHITEMAAGGVPPAAGHAARRCLVNAFGLAVAAGGHHDVDRLVEACRRGGEDGEVPLPGRSDSLGLLAAATVVGTAAHLEDFDDTHLDTVIHPGPVTLASLWALVAADPAILGARPGDAARRADAAVAAVACGVEAQLRIGLAMSPEHYDAGWHITGTCGAFGAATVAAVLWGLDAGQLCSAWGAAGSMALGHREAFGTFVKPFHAGKAAANGILAALLVRTGMDATSRVLEAPRGFFGVLAGGQWHPDRLAGSADRWMIEDVGYKPYPCGVVAHPAIEASVDVAGQVAQRGIGEVVSVRVRCHPLVVELMGNPEPTSGMAAKYSTSHVVAAALVRRRVGLAELSDDAVADPTIAALRPRVVLEVDPSVARDAAFVTVETRTGLPLAIAVDHVAGSALRPLADPALDDKFRALAAPVLGPARAEDLLAGIWSLGQGSTFADLVPLARPTQGARP